MGGPEKEWMGCSLDDLRAFGIDADQWTSAAQDEGAWRRTVEQGAEHFMAKGIAAEEARAGLRHAMVYPNLTGRTKERIAQSKRARLVRSPFLISHKWRELVSSGRLVYRCHDVFLWCYLCFVLLCFRLHAFVKAAAPRSIVLRYAGAPIATFCFLHFLHLEMSLFPSIFCTVAVFSLYGEYDVRSFLPDGVFLPCDHGLDL